MFERWSIGALVLERSFERWSIGTLVLERSFERWSVSQKGILLLALVVP